LPIFGQQLHSSQGEPTPIWGTSLDLFFLKTPKLHKFHPKLFSTTNNTRFFFLNCSFKNGAKHRPLPGPLWLGFVLFFFSPQELSPSSFYFSGTFLPGGQLWVPPGGPALVFIRPAYVFPPPFITALLGWIDCCFSVWFFPKIFKCCLVQTDPPVPFTLSRPLQFLC